MAQDFNREIDKLEDRIRREMEYKFAAVLEKMRELEVKLDAINNDTKTQRELAEHARIDNKTWFVRYIISIVVSFFIGSGALGFVQFIMELLARK